MQGIPIISCLKSVSSKQTKYSALWGHTEVYTVGFVLDRAFCLLVCSMRLDKQGTMPSESFLPSLFLSPKHSSGCSSYTQGIQNEPRDFTFEPNHCYIPDNKGFPPATVQKQPPAKDTVISTSAGSSPMAKQNLFLSGSSINTTSWRLKGAKLLTREWPSAVKMEGGDWLTFIFLGKKKRKEDRERTGSADQYLFLWTQSLGIILSNSLWKQTNSYN